MHGYAQNILQLYHQLQHEGYANGERSYIRDAYELAISLFSCRFQPSGKIFIAHIVGTASILASLRLPAPVVAAGLLHNAYGSGDFGKGTSGITRAKRKLVRDILGTEAEYYVAGFPAMRWNSQSIATTGDNCLELDTAARRVLLLRLADHLEHLLDLDILFYEERDRQLLIDNAPIAARIAEKLGFPMLAAGLREAADELAGVELPKELYRRRAQKYSFVIAPTSCRRRTLDASYQKLRQGVYRLRRSIENRLRLLHSNSPCR